MLLLLLSIFAQFYIVPDDSADFYFTNQTEICPSLLFNFQCPVCQLFNASSKLFRSFQNIALRLAAPNSKNVETLLSATRLPQYGILFWNFPRINIIYYSCLNCSSFCRTYMLSVQIQQYINNFEVLDVLFPSYPITLRKNQAVCQVVIFTAVILKLRC